MGGAIDIDRSHGRDGKSERTRVYIIREPNAWSIACPTAGASQKVFFFSSRSVESIGVRAKAR